VPLVKPPTPVWQPGHPLARDCRLYFPFAERAGSPRDLAGGVAGTMGAGASWTTGPAGAEIDTDGGAAAGVNVGTLAAIYGNLTPPVSLAVRVRVDAGHSYITLGKNGNGQDFAILIGIDNHIEVVTHRAPTYLVGTTGANAIVNGTYHDILAIWLSSTTHALYIDGKAQSITYPLAGPITALGTAVGNFLLGGEPSVTRTVDGRLTFAAMWKADMRSQAAAIAADPWAPARPRTRLIVPFGGAGGGAAAIEATAGIASTLTLGTQVASYGALASSVGIASTLTLGDPVASVGGLAVSVGIASTLVVGDPVASVGALAVSVGIVSTLVVGSPAGSYGTLATSVGIASTLVVGSPAATWDGAGPEPQVDIRIALQSLMSGEADLTATVGTRIYPAPRPQSAVLPCLTYRLITGNPGHDLVAADGTVRSRFQVEAWSRTTAEAAALSVGLFNSLDGFVGTVDGVRITWVAKLDEADLSSLESDGTGDPKRRIVSDYLVQYRVAIPTR
jgi:hypothetical protein